ncbi:MAG: hypothetical protein H8E60_09900 [Candidatus Marinimicrobia bacterium]|nr:hypothetical protein [Candidatus Neomarinimicrobiota bacterium]
MNTPLLILLVLIAIGGGVYYYISLRPGSKSSLKESYSEGLDLLVSGQRKEAYQHFKTIVQHDTNNVKAYIKLGQVIREGGNPTQALKIHKNLTIRSKITTFEKIELHKNLSLDYADLGNLENAISEAENILNLNKTSEWALSHLIDFYKKKENWGKASEYLHQYQEVTKTQDSHLVGLYKIQEGRIALKNKEFQKSRELLEDSLKIDSDLSSGYLFLGNSFADESEIAYKKAMDIDDKEFQTQDEKQEYVEFVQLAKQQLARAIPMWVQFTERESEQSWLVLPKIKDALFALNRFNEIEEVLKKILKNDADNVDAISSLADFYNQKGSRKEAIDMISFAIEKEPDSLIANVIRLKLSTYKGDLNEVRKDCDNLISLFMKEVYQQMNSHNVKGDIDWLEKNSPKGTSIQA